LNETVPFCCIEPLYCALFCSHFTAPN
jgi:hypothetical protein